MYDSSPMFADVLSTSSTNAICRIRLFIIQQPKPLLLLHANHMCVTGLIPEKATKRLIGKHFPYKSKKRGRCLVCSDRKTSTERGRIQKPRIFVRSVMCFYASKNASKITIPAQATDLVQSALPSSDFVKLLFVLMPVQVCLCVYIYSSYHVIPLQAVAYC